jgi:hypothetical protein
MQCLIFVSLPACLVGCAGNAWFEAWCCGPPCFGVLLRLQCYLSAYGELAWHTGSCWKLGDKTYGQMGTGAGAVVMSGHEKAGGSGEGWQPLESLMTFIVG